MSCLCFFNEKSQVLVRVEDMKHIRIREDGVILIRGLPAVAGYTKEDLDMCRRLADQNRYDEIPDRCLLRMGWNDTGITVMSLGEWMNHPNMKAFIEEERKSPTRIYLNSGYTPFDEGVSWNGDISLPVDVILEECKKILKFNGSYIPDSEIKERVLNAKIDHAMAAGK